MSSLLAAVFILLPILIDTFSIPPTRDVDLTHHQGPTTFDQAQTGWSRQDIFTLISVCVAVAGILIGLLLASSKLREWLCHPFKYAIVVRQRRIRQQIDAERRLQEEYNEYLEFKSFRAMRGSSQ